LVWLTVPEAATVPVTASAALRASVLVPVTGMVPVGESERVAASVAVPVSGIEALTTSSKSVGVQ
jgi:hypothetical protein